MSLKDMTAGFEGASGATAVDHHGGKVVGTPGAGKSLDLTVAGAHRSWRTSQVLHGSPRPVTAA